MCTFLLAFLAFVIPLFPSPQIRPAQESDIPQIHQLIGELVVSEGHDIESVSVTHEDLRCFGFRENPFFFVEVAEIDGQIVGQAIYFFTFSASQGKPILYVKDLYVKAEYRKGGIGTQLLKQLAHYAHERKCCRIEGLVSDWNVETIALYEKLGAQLKRCLIPVRMDCNKGTE